MDDLVINCVTVMFPWINELMEDKHTASLGCPCGRPIYIKQWTSNRCFQIGNNITEINQIDKSIKSNHFIQHKTFTRNKQKQITLIGPNKITGTKFEKSMKKYFHLKDLQSLI